MKTIIFTTIHGSKIDFASLTGFRSPETEDENVLDVMARGVMAVDTCIADYEIIEPVTA